MYFAAWRCPEEGECWNWDRSAVAVELSGLVQCESHYSEPIICCIVLRNLSQSSTVMVEVGIESIGRSDWYGDLGAIRLSSCSPAYCAIWLMNAGWDRCAMTSSLPIVQVNSIPEKCVTIPIKSTLVSLDNCFSNSFSTLGSTQNCQHRCQHI